MESKRRLNTEQAAAYLGIRKSYLYKLCHLGRVPFYRPSNGKSWFDADDLDRYLDRGRRAADYELADRADALLMERR